MVNVIFTTSFPAVSAQYDVPSLITKLNSLIVERGVTDFNSGNRYTRILLLNNLKSTNIT